MTGYLIPGVKDGAELAEHFGKCSDAELMRWAAEWISDAVGVWEGEDMRAPETFGKYLHCELRERADKSDLLAKVNAGLITREEAMRGFG